MCVHDQGWIELMVVSGVETNAKVGVKVLSRQCRARAQPPGGPLVVHGSRERTSVQNGWCRQSVDRCCVVRTVKKETPEHCVAMRLKHRSVPDSRGTAPSR